MISGPDFEKKQILFIFTTRGEKLSFSNDNIVVKDKDGKIKHQSTCYRLFIVFVIGEITITSGLIQRAKRFGFSICLMNRNMKLYEVIGHRLEGNTLLHEKQYKYEGIDIGREIITNKILNQRRALLTIRKRNESATDAAKKLSEYAARVSDERLQLQDILGLEGLSARLYFKELYADFGWNGRKPRIKMDYINSAMDIGYSILFNVIEAMLRVYGFDIYYGVLHRQFYMRKSLVCDLVEPFRPIVDLQIRKSINLGQCSVDDFELMGSRYVLKWKMSPKYSMFLTQPLMDNKMELYRYVQQYYRSVMKEKNASEYPRYKLEW